MKKMKIKFFFLVTVIFSVPSKPFNNEIFFGYYGFGFGLGFLVSLFFTVSVF